jgi:quinol monooxygenase YgiN
MITTTLCVEIPAAKRADVIRVFDSLIGPTSVQPGCISVKLYSDVNNDDDLMLIEEWNSQKDLERHIRSDDFRKILAVMDLAAKPPEISFQTISSTAGFDLVEKLMGKKRSS